MKLSLARLLLASFVAASSLGACSAPGGEGPDGNEGDEQGAPQREDELKSDEESFSSYDATEAELASAEPTAPLDNEMTLFAIPAPKLFGLKWKRPGGLARRTLLNVGLGFSRALGHAAVRVSCEGRTFTGSVYDTGDDFKKMVIEEKAGLGVLFRTVPGVLETAEELQPTLDERYENGRISFIRFALSKDTCTALLDYAKAFTAANIAKEYGFVRPLYREGAGCSAFSMAFLELANLDEARFRSAWSFDVRVPMKLIGGKDNPGNKVSVFELFATFRPWASETEPHLRLAGWDPTLMFTSIRSWSKQAARSGSERTEKRGKALGLVLDRRSVTPRAELTNRTYWAGNPGDPRDWWGFGDP
jgi:hypothetical protein